MLSRMSKMSGSSLALWQSGASFELVVRTTEVRISLIKHNCGWLCVKTSKSARAYVVPAHKQLY
jgi:hypothetical protein